MHTVNQGFVQLWECNFVRFVEAVAARATRSTPWTVAVMSRLSLQVLVVPAPSMS